MKVTLEQVKENIVREEVWNVPGTKATIVALICKNGYVASGFNNCADEAEHDAEYGLQSARQEAMDDVWKQMGYELRTEMLKAKILRASETEEMGYGRKG